MQEFLTQAAVAVELVSFGYMTSSFVVYACRRTRSSVSWVPKQVPQELKERTRTKEIESSSLRVGNQSQSPPPTQVKRKLSPVEQLRQQCQQAGIKWRDAHGKNKHLKKAELIAALQQLELERAKQTLVPPKPNQPKPNQHSKAA